MNPGRFFVPRMGTNIGPMMRVGYLPTRGGFGIFGRIANSLRSFNWSGLLNGASKTLNVVNQTIPLVRQAGPMLNNMKSMLRLAKVFGNETNNKTRPVKANNNKQLNTSMINDKDTIEDANLKKEVTNDNYPNFFV